MTRRIAAAALLGLAFLVAVVSLRLVLDGRRHLSEAASLQAAGEHERALVALEEAARAYLPGSPYPPRALERLSLAARAQEMRGETAAARRCWEVVRRSILASRHVTQPNAGMLETAERQITRLVAAAPGAGVADPVARPRDPGPILSLLLSLGLLAWLGGSVALLLVPGRPENGRKGRIVAWLAALGGLGLWLSMSWLAG